MATRISCSKSEAIAEAGGLYWLAATLFLICVPLLAHVLFSWIGFNPTDDGFTLAYSRRILSGEVPHRDFIIIRPFLSPLIHVPFVALGGDRTFYISRLFVWVEFACIAWIWVHIADKLLRTRVRSGQRFLFALVAFVFSAHSFPIMAWHTVDALLLISIGLALCLGESTLSCFFGFVLIGSAYLCKQNFLLVVPVALIVLERWRKPIYWLAVALPGIAYLLFLVLTHSLNDAAVQLTAQTGVLGPGFWRYVSDFAFTLGVVLGYLGTRMMLQADSESRRAKGLSMVLLAPILSCLGLASGHFTSHWAVGLFGMVLGMSACFARTRKERGYWTLGVLVTLVAWSVSISVGYNTPALAAGPTVIVLLSFVSLLACDGKPAVMMRYATLVLAVLAVSSFAIVRLNHVYRDRKALNLDCSLTGVLPGAAGLRTNPVTCAYLQDLRNIIASLGDMDYCVVPDTAACWVQSPHLNPLPVDWANATELNKPRLLRRELATITNHRGPLAVIVQNFDAGSLASDLCPVSAANDVVSFVRKNLHEARETQYFKVYTAARL